MGVLTPENAGTYTRSHGRAEQDQNPSVPCSLGGGGDMAAASGLETQRLLAKVRALWADEFQLNLTEAL